ncbi:uncharacterized protein LOC120352506 isoform X2 [Nilaparvata lugens]|uniref:uncharacterized protein LOC120352506 isoform X2 n=1 Tax=Nilaparvata lugens TaxID=108931 RepID=UPI00193D4956|nr:uncharacterized protein LOC120352506 isoform X2 [Nilaparvata lugens]
MALFWCGESREQFGCGGDIESWSMEYTWHILIRSCHGPQLSSMALDRDEPDCWMYMTTSLCAMHRCLYELDIPDQNLQVWLLTAGVMGGGDTFYAAWHTDGPLDMSSTTPLERWMWREVHAWMM